jgi:ParB-like chromosome segregation protein Spo0J
MKIIKNRTDRKDKIMKDIIIDEEFQFLLPPLDADSIIKLEESILKHGCRNPLVLWNNTLIDGYNRYKILQYHDLPFNTVNMEFDNREEVKIWIIENQIAQRNLNSIKLSYFRGLHYNLDKKLHGDIGRTALNNARYQNDTLQNERTRKRLADQYNVSQNTIMRNSRLAMGLTSIGEIDTDVKRDILFGNQRISMSRLESLASADTEEVQAVIDEIKTGEFVHRTPRGSGVTTNSGTNIDRPISFNEQNPFLLPELRQLNNIISDFANSFNRMLSEIDSNDPAPLKSVLRSYINQLEELYQNLLPD